MDKEWKGMGRNKNSTKLVKLWKDFLTFKKNLII